MKILFVLVVIALTTLGCADPGSSCSQLCIGGGFTGGTANVDENEVNCFCIGGDAAAALTADSCTQMCSGIGMSAGEIFNSTAATADDACQCTP